MLHLAQFLQSDLLLRSVDLLLWGSFSPSFEFSWRNPSTHRHTQYPSPHTNRKINQATIENVAANDGSAKRLLGTSIGPCISMIYKMSISWLCEIVLITFNYCLIIYTMKQQSTDLPFATKPRHISIIYIPNINLSNQNFGQNKQVLKGSKVDWFVFLHSDLNNWRISCGSYSSNDSF